MGGMSRDIPSTLCLERSYYLFIPPPLLSLFHFSEGAHRVSFIRRGGGRICCIIYFVIVLLFLHYLRQGSR